MENQKFGSDDKNLKSNVDNQSVGESKGAQVTNTDIKQPQKQFNQQTSQQADQNQFNKQPLSGVTKPTQTNQLEQDDDLDIDKDDSELINQKGQTGQQSDDKLKKPAA